MEFESKLGFGGYSAVAERIDGVEWERRGGGGCMMVSGGGGGDGRFGVVNNVPTSRQLSSSGSATNNGTESIDSSLGSLREREWPRECRCFSLMAFRSSSSFFNQLNPLPKEVNPYCLVPRLTVRCTRKIGSGANQPSSETAVISSTVANGACSKVCATARMIAFEKKIPKRDLRGNCTAESRSGKKDVGKRKMK